MVNVVMATMVLAVSLPAGWLLLEYGLCPAVTKYGRGLSGVDFLLGPDREELLPDITLMLGWFVAQCAAIAMLACGMQVMTGQEGPRQ